MTRIILLNGEGRKQAFEFLSVEGVNEGGMTVGMSFLQWKIQNTYRGRFKKMGVMHKISRVSTML